MNRQMAIIGWIKGVWVGVALVAGSAGCIVPVGGGYVGDVVVPGPDFVVFGGGGGYDRGRDAHAYSERGYSSRAVAHGGGGGGGHAGHGGNR